MDISTENGTRPLAEDTKLKRKVALKFLPEAVRSDPESLRRFRVEAEAAAKLNHPNIATIYSIEEADDQTFIAMEYVDGKTLSDHIPDDGLDSDQFFDWFVPLTDALAHAHEHGRIHRDLKPGNIMIASNGTPKILDFGLARIEKDETGSSELDSDAPTMTMKTAEKDIPPSLTQGGTFLGTPAYMSPEQIEGKKVDARTDIFSFGVVMYEALTGQRPFKGGNIESIIGRILTEEPVSVTSLKPITPYTLWVCIRQCLKKDRNHRMQTAQQLYPTLKDVHQETQTGTVLVDASMIPEPVVEAAKPVAIWRQPGALLIMAMLVIATATAAWILKPAPISESPLRKFTLPVEAQVNTLDGPVLSPDGTMVVYTKNSAGPLWVRDLNQTEPRVLPGTDGAERPFWSTNSRQIGYMQDVIAGRAVLRTVSAQGGPSTLVCNLPVFSFPRGAAWMPDGQIVFSFVAGKDVTTPGAGTLYTVSAGGGEPRVFLAPDSTRGEVGFTYPQVLPDGKTFIVSLTTTDAAGTLVTLTDDSVTELFRDPGALLMFPVYASSGHIIYQRRNNNAGNVAASVWALPFNALAPVTTGEPFLVAEAQQMPSVSVDGTLLYSTGMERLLFSGLNSRQLVWVDRSGTVTDTIGQAGMLHIALSPDSKAVAATVAGNGMDIWVFDTELGTSRRLSFDPGQDAGPAWSPTGDQIAFFSRRSGKPEIYIRAANGRGTAELIAELSITSVSNSGLDWSPDGRFLVYSSDNVGNFDLWYVPLKGKRTPVTVLAAPSNERQPSLSPDGQYLAYQSDASGRDEVYITSFPSDDGQWQVSVNGGGNPRWNGRGDELFYVEKDQVMIVPVKTASIFEAGTPQVLFAAEHIDALLSQIGIDRFDVSRDGQRFVLLQNVTKGAETRATITIVENWYKEFEMP